MSTLSVWRFDTPEGAEKAVTTLAGLSQQKLVTVHDAATVTWQPGAKKPKTRQLQDLTGAGALGGAFWGMLFGLLFLVPLLGAAIGAAAGALTGRLTDVGIDDDFIKEVRTEVTPGTSALFVMASSAVLDKLKGTFEGMDVRLIRTNLTEAQEQELLEHFHLVD